MSSDRDPSNSAHLSRRKFLGTVSTAAAMAVTAGCSRNSPQTRSGEYSGQTLNVFVYSGLDRLFQEYFVEPFEASTGAKVVLDVGWGDAITKLKQSQSEGEPAFDLVLTDATQGYPAIKSGLFRQMDFNNIPNHRALAPVSLDNWVAKERYGVTFHESAMSLIWDRRQVSHEPTGWGDLLREDLRGKLAFYNWFYMSLYTFACMKVAAEGKPGLAARAVNDDLGGVLDFARRESKRLRFWWPNGEKMKQDLLQGNFAAGNAHSVTALQSIGDKPDVIGVTTPVADRVYVQLMWVIPAATPRAALAEIAIDFLLRTDVQAAMARHGAGTSHREAARIVAAENPLWAKTYPSTEAEFLTMRYFPYEAYFRDWDRIAREWQHEVLIQS